MGANYSFEVKNIEIWAPAFFKHNNSFVTTVAFNDPAQQLVLFFFFKLKEKVYLLAIENRIGCFQKAYPENVVQANLGNTPTNDCLLSQL